MRLQNDVMTDEPQLLLNDVISRVLAGRRDGIVRVEIPVEAVDALAWLHAQPWPDHVFLSSRDDGWTMAGAGVADLIESNSADELEAALLPRLDAAPSHIRYFGTMRFRPDESPQEEWQGFGRIRFVLPRVELIVQDGTTKLALNAMPGESVDDLKIEANRIMWESGVLGGSLPDIIGRQDLPDKHTWCEGVDSVLGTQRALDLGKVVLARRASYSFEKPLDPFVLLSRMQVSTQNCFHALVGLGQGTQDRTAFLSATPERLFRMEGGEVISEAVAGTRLRSRNEDLDRILRDELLHSAKDLREQKYVLDAVRKSLESLSDDLEVDENPSSFNHSKGRHLRSILKGRLKDSVSAIDLIHRLHPTPAVAGSPLAQALSEIKKHEPFDRGLYAGPIGWIGSDAAEFAVGIRSGLVEGNNLHLYSGAGIVEGSDPEDEWDEIEHKLDDFSQALGLLE